MTEFAGKMAAKTATLTATETDKGSRLDAFVARALSCGLREAKRRIEGGCVTVNGKARPPHFKLLAGNVVSVAREGETGISSPFEDAVRLLAITNDFSIFYKPAGLHTAAVAGRDEPSLERAVVANWAMWRMGKIVDSPPEGSGFPPAFMAALGGEKLGQNTLVDAWSEAAPTLVTRLDAATSGLVTAAFGQANVIRFREYEKMGAVSKYYLAVTDGLPPGPLVLRAALDTDSRVKTRVLDTDTSDATRHSEIFPLGEAGDFLESAPAGTGLVAVRIKRGARHQIRAHLAGAGFPLHGDALYGGQPDSQVGGAPFYLHHARLVMPGLDVFCPPPWPPSGRAERNFGNHF